MHFAGEMFKKATGVDMQRVPYKGVGPSVTDAVGGQVKVLFTSLGSGLVPLIRAGNLVPRSRTITRAMAGSPGSSASRRIERDALPAQGHASEASDLDSIHQPSRSPDRPSESGAGLIP